MRRYCLRCSESTGRLVERSCPAAERERARRLESKRERERREREKANERRRRRKQQAERTRERRRSELVEPFLAAAPCTDECRDALDVRPRSGFVHCPTHCVYLFREKVQGHAPRWQAGRWRQTLSDGLFPGACKLLPDVHGEWSDSAAEAFVSLDVHLENQA